MSMSIIKVLLISFSFIFNNLTILSLTLPSYASGQGEWHLLQRSIGISAMHMQLMHDNKVVMFDRTDFGPSNLSLPGGRCRHDPFDQTLKNDCTAHSILYNVATNTYRPLMVQTDTWCSSGAIHPNGTLIQTGGFNDGDHVVRAFTSCMNNNCDWIEFPNYLSRRRWYASNQILPDGRIIVVGGRRQFNYEFVPNPSRQIFRLPFLRETRDSYAEDNLYPFLHLLPDGNLFIFASTRSILLDYKKNRVLREFPRIPGDVPRNYPSTGSSVLLPLDDSRSDIVAEVLVCGGAPRESFWRSNHGNFIPADSTCGRLIVTDRNPRWVMETMPIRRVMGDMLLLPSGDVLIINGAQLGSAGWEAGRNPVTRPIIYSPSRQLNRRFSIMPPSGIPRMYHSAATLLADGRVLVGGSNPNRLYNFTGVLFPTELSLEAYSPPYLSRENAAVRPVIRSVRKIVRYRQKFGVAFDMGMALTKRSYISARIIAPSFTTHSYGMNQRMVVLRVTGMTKHKTHTYRLSVVGPSTPEIAPPGYYLLFLEHAGIPSYGIWMKIQ